MSDYQFYLDKSVLANATVTATNGATNTPIFTDSSLAQYVGPFYEWDGEFSGPYFTVNVTLPVTQSSGHPTYLNYYLPQDYMSYSTEAAAEADGLVNINSTFAADVKLLTEHMYQANQLGSAFEGIDAGDGAYVQAVSALNYDWANSGYNAITFWGPAGAMVIDSSNIIQDDDPTLVGDIVASWNDNDYVVDELFTFPPSEASGEMTSPVDTDGDGVNDSTMYSNSFTPSTDFNTTLATSYTSSAGAGETGILNMEMVEKDILFIDDKPDQQLGVVNPTTGQMEFSTVDGYDAYLFSANTNFDYTGSFANSDIVFV